MRDRRGRSVLDSSLLESILSEVNPDMVVLEMVGAMMGDGASSMFAFGRVYGSIETVLERFSFRVVDANPGTWKRRTRTPTDKAKAVAHARSVFPHLAHQLKFKKDHDKAEALMMTIYGRDHVE